MADTTFTLYLPCEVYTVRPWLRTRRSISDARQLALEAIGRGRDTVQALDLLFGLGERPTMDLLIGLWREGRIELDLDEERIALAPETAAALAEGRLGKLGASPVKGRPVRVMRELIDGHVLPFMPFESISPDALTIPPVLARGQIDPHRHDELLDAVRWILDREVYIQSAQQSQHELASVELVTDGVGMDSPPMVSARDLAILARITRDPTDGCLRTEVVYPQSLPSPVRHAIGRRLSNLESSAQHRDFFRRLEDRIVSTVTPTTVLDEAHATMVELVSRLDPEEPDAVQPRHQECSRLSDGLLDLLAERLDNQCVSTIHANTQDIIATVERAISETRRQLVMVCPFVHVDGYTRFSAALRRLLSARPVTVHIIWGIEKTHVDPDGEDADERISPFVQGMIDLNASDTLGRVFIERRRTNTHAKVLVRDDEQLIVGTHNFLGMSPPSAKFELAVSLTPAEPGDFLPLAGHALAWAQASYPDYSRARLLRTTARELRGPDHRSCNGHQRPEMLVLARSRPDEARDPGRQDTHADVEELRGRWRSWLDDVTSVAGSIGTSAEIVLDEEHRRWVWRALRERSGPLVLASDRMSREVLDERFVEALEARLQRGSQVTLLYRDPHPPDLVQTTLGPLLRRFSRNLRVERRRTHVKLLAWDEGIIVSSFNFLSFLGRFDGRRRHRTRSEFGVLLRGEGVATKILQALHRSIAAVDPDVPINFGHIPWHPLGLAHTTRARVPEHSPEPDPDRLASDAEPGDRPIAPGEVSDVSGVTPPPERWMRSMLATLREIEMPDARAQLVHSGFSELRAGNHDVWAGLEALAERLGDAADAIEVGALWCLGATPSSGINTVDRERRLRWADHIARRAWRRRDFRLAAIASSELPKAVVGLPAMLVVHAAASLDSTRSLARSLATIADHLGASGLEPIDVAVLGLIGVLEHHLPEAQRLIDGVAGAIEAPLSHWLDAVSGAWQTGGLVIGMNEIRDAADARMTSDEGEDVRYETLTHIDEVAQANWQGVKRAHAAWASMFAAGGAIGQLRSLMESSDRTAARDWLDRYRDKAALERLYEDAGGGSIHSRLRRRAIAYLDMIRDGVESWLEFAEPNDAGNSLFAIERATDLARALSVHRSGFEAMVRSLADSPSWPLCEALRDRLTPLFALVESAELTSERDDG